MASGTAVDPAGSYGPGLLRSIWRYRYGIAVVGVVSVLLGYLVSTLLTPVYETTATILLSDAGAFGDQAPDPEREVQQEANRLTSRAVFNRAAERLDGVTASEVRQSVTVAADPVIGSIEVTATSDDPDAAAEIANTVTDEYQEVSREATTSRVESAQELLQTQGVQLRKQIATLREQPDAQSDPVTQQRIELLESELVALQTRISEMRTDAALFGAGVEEVEPALTPGGPVSPQPLRNAAIAGVVGLAIASAVAYWRAGVVESAKLDPAMIVGAPLLAEIPVFKQASGAAPGDNPLFDLDAVEAYQFLLSSVEYAMAETRAQSILVTSARPGDGKSLTALHLARALAIQGREVMLVDADIRARGLTTLLRAQDKPGLVAMAEGAPPEDVVRRYRISQSVELPVIPAGQPPHQLTGLLATDRYRDAINQIVARDRLTIIDGGPLLTVADASAVAMQVSGVLLIIDAKTPSEDLIRVRDRMRLVSTPLLGYVLNRVPDAGQTMYPYGVNEPRGSAGWFKRLLRSDGVRSQRTPAIE